MRRRKEKAAVLRAEVGEEGKDSGGVAICTWAATYYLVDGTVRSSWGRMMAEGFPFDTGTGLNIILKSALPEGRESEVDEKTKPPKLSDANGRPLSLGKSAWLTVKFANTL